VQLVATVLQGGFDPEEASKIAGIASTTRSCESAH
jgi:hypothetical protein